MDSKPTTITAQEFIDNGYAAKIEAGECVVKSPLYKHYVITDVKPIKANSSRWDVAITDTKSTYRAYSSAVFSVTWLAQATAQPQPATAPTAGGAGGWQESYYTFNYMPYPIRITQGDNEHPTNYAVVRIYDKQNNKTVDFVESKAIVELETELAALRAQVAALSSERDAMRVLVTSLELALCYFPNKPRLRDFETTSDYDIAYEKWSAMDSVVQSLALYNRVKS